MPICFVGSVAPRSTYSEYVSLVASLAALHLDLFERPAEFFRILLGGLGRLLQAACGGSRAAVDMLG